MAVPVGIHTTWVESVETRGAVARGDAEENLCGEAVQPGQLAVLDLEEDVHGRHLMEGRLLWRLHLRELDQRDPQQLHVPDACSPWHPCRVLCHQARAWALRKISLIN